MTIQRFETNPIVRPDMDAHMGANVNGPSLICVPDWVADPLGRYYLYFAHHHGETIRLAVADDLAGPWRTHEPGTLRLEQTPCRGHIASPDVHVDADCGEIRMYYHGPADVTPDASAVGVQRSFVAVSADGVTFAPVGEMVGNSYVRAFRWGGMWYFIGMPGVFYRSADGLSGFEQGPTLFGPAMRHSAVRLVGETLHVFYSNAGDCPERILLATIDLTGDWSQWRASEPRTVLEPELDYEGVGLPLVPSERGWAPQPVRQLRDPAIFEQDDRTYLLYSVAGESGIGIAEMCDR